MAQGPRVIDAAPTPDELLQAALEYARQGWAVFPVHTPINGVCDCQAGPGCDSPGKHPWTRNGLTDASTDELQIRRWWKARPIANVGLSVREGYVIVDVDGDHGQRRLQVEEKHLVATAVQSSGRGAHYVYRTRERIPPRSGLIPESEKGAHDGVDLRGPGSYVVAAPSLHASGRVYTWSIPLSQIEVAPPWLEEISRHSGGTTVGDRAPVDFEMVLAGLPEGQRKWELYRAASKLRAADVPLDFAVELAVQAAARCNPPLDASEAERKVREAYTKYPPNASARDLPAGVTLLAADSVMVEFETARFTFSDLEKAGRELHAEMEVQSLLPGHPTEPYVQRLNLLSMSAREACRRELDHVLGSDTKGQWTALLARAVAKGQQAFLSVDRSVRASEIDAPSELRFIVPDLVAEDGLTLLFGAGSAGKTFLLLDLAVAASRGEQHLGRECEQKNVLYIDYETGQGTFGYRLKRVCAGRGLTQADASNVFYWWANGIPFEDQIDAIKRCCEENQIGLVCLDHIAAACGGDASEQSVASRFQRALGKLGLPMIALAHITGAASNDPESARRPFGSIFWENTARRTIFILRQQEDDAPVADLGLYPRKVNDGGKPSAFGASLTFEDPDGPIFLEVATLAGKGALNRLRGPHHAIWDVLNHDMTVPEIADASGISERHVKRVLADHPRMFVTVSGGLTGGRGNQKRWARTADDREYWWQDNDELPFEK